MIVKIKSCYDNKVLYTAEDVEDVRGAVEEAVQRGVSLRGADLRNINLWSADLRDAKFRGADLEGANLRGTSLHDADLRDANLQDADLRGADLWKANLRRVDLRNADLRSICLQCACLQAADLWGADLRGADLWSADLRNTDLRNADFRGVCFRNTDLRGVNGLNAYRINDLLMMLDQPGPIRAYKLVNQKGEGVYRGGIRYRFGEVIEVEDADTDPTHECGAGINLATLAWCLRAFTAGRRILVCEFTKDDIAALPISDGKFRVHRCKVVGEKSLEELGITRDGRDCV